MSPDVLIVRTGSANLASVANGLARVDVQATVSDDASRVREAPLVVLPGVGAFGPAMQRLRVRGLDAAVLDRVRLGRPLLAICLGMQLLCDGSEECVQERGLGIIPGVVRRFGGDVRVPQMGWNQVVPTPGTKLLREAAMYFANSYRLESLPPGWGGALSQHGGQFVSAAERGPILACQFHPELSGGEGLSLIRRWLSLNQRRGAVAC
jgi:imidazole glycerol phosphate synthase glutamine amidotransferase subunit